MIKKEFRNTGYYVDNFGQIYGKKKTLKPTITPYGYNSVCLYFNGKYKTFLVHRIVAECFIENPYNKPDINHIDGNKTNNNVNNLEWVTSKENNQHAIKVLGHRKIGQCPNSKLTLSQMQEIYKYNKEENIYMSVLARKYNVHRTTISRVINNLKR